MMALWWMTEALPIAATALVPLVLFPVLQVADIGATAAPYANPLIFLFMGGFMIALAMERWNLHRRLALSIIDQIGTRPHAIVAGFMVAGAFLSMWISNTATAMMMLPIGLSVVDLVRRQTREGRNFAVVLMLALAYSCSVGGIGTLVGTPTNVLLAGFMSETYGFEIAFANWLLLGLLFVVVVIVLLTELTSNTATAAAFLPIVASVAIGIGQNPLLLAVPATVAASCAFMLPVATPPNAIIYGSSVVTVPQMARAGVVLNMIFVLFVTLLTYLLLPFVFDLTLGVVPEWATAP